MPNRKQTLITDTVIQIFRANGQLLHWGDGLTGLFGLTSARWQMLGALIFSGRPMTAPQMANSMGVTRQGALKQLNLLEAEALVEKHPNPMNKRSPLYRLTDEGEARYHQIQNRWYTHLEDIEHAFSATDLHTTLMVLEKLKDLHETPPG